MAELEKMTWATFKRKAEANGLLDTDIISYIDWGGHASDPDPNVNTAYVLVGKYSNGEVAISD